MLISQDALVSDPVAMTRIIVRTLLAELDSSAGRSAGRIGVLNILRLLERYRYENFRKAPALDAAVAAAHRKIRPRLGREAFADRLGRSLVKFAPDLLPDAGSIAPVSIDVELVRGFLEALLSGLAPADPQP